MKFVYVFLVCVFISASVISQPDSGSVPFQRQIDTLKEKDNLEAYIYVYLDEFLKDPKKLDLLENMRKKQWRKPQTGAEMLALTILLCNEGYYLMRYGQIEEAVNAYEAAWAYFQEYDFQNFDIIEYALKPLGNAYSMLGDYASAESIIKSYLLKAREQGRERQQIAALINLSIVYHDTGKNHQAIDILQQAIDESMSTGQAGLIYSNLAKNYLKINEAREAKASALRAFALFKKDGASENTSYLVNTYSMLSLISLQARDTLQAVKFLEEAKALAMVSEAIQPRERAKINIQLAGIQAGMGDDEMALAHYTKALKGLIPEYSGGRKLPVDELLYAENALKEAFDGMAVVHVKKGSLKEAIVCYAKSFEIEELLKRTYNYREAKYLQQEENRRRAEKVISLSYRLFQSSRDTTHLQQAFSIAERTKSIALKDELYSRQAWSKYAHDSLLVAKAKLTQQKSVIENALVQEQLKAGEADIYAIEQLIDKKNQLMLALKQLNKAMADKYSLSLQHVDRQFNIDSLQRKISSEGVTMIEYFFGAEALYIFVLDGSSVRIYRNGEIAEVRKQVMRYAKLFDNEVKINAAPEIFAATSQKLFKMLLPVKVDTTLLLIPDGLLNFIPFETLLTSSPPSLNYSSWPWLIKQAPVFYQYSAALYLPEEELAGGFTSRNVLGLFPQFVDSKRFLKYSEDEAKRIEQYFEGDFIDKEKATKQAFLERVPRYPIVHLSTHAKTGGLHEPPSIAFIDSALYLTEIYGLNLQTELLVLGACETGIGKLYKGEGLLSLANGFLHAGVKNIVLSLWKVNDYSTSRLMGHFYRNYKSQPYAHLALHQAKLDYLQDRAIASDKKSPYYWASFVYYGGTEVRQAEKFAYSGYIIAAMIVAFVSLMMLLFYRHKKRISANR